MVDDGEVVLESAHEGEGGDKGRVGGVGFPGLWVEHKTGEGGGGWDGVEGGLLVEEGEDGADLRGV